MQSRCENIMTYETPISSNIPAEMFQTSTFFIFCSIYVWNCVRALRVLLITENAHKDFELFGEIYVRHFLHLYFTFLTWLLRKLKIIFKMFFLFFLIYFFSSLGSGGYITLGILPGNITWEYYPGILLRNINRFSSRVKDQSFSNKPYVNRSTEYWSFISISVFPTKQRG